MEWDEGRFKMKKHQPRLKLKINLWIIVTEHNSYYFLLQSCGKKQYSKWSKLQMETLSFFCIINEFENSIAA